MNGIGKQFSLLQHGNIYSCKKFNSSGSSGNSRAITIKLLLNSTAIDQSSLMRFPWSDAFSKLTDC